LTMPRFLVRGQTYELNPKQVQEFMASLSKPNPERKV